jgi:PQQ-like domain
MTRSMWNKDWLLTLLLVLTGASLLVAPAHAQSSDSLRMKQLRLLCVQLSGDLTEPGGLAAFRRCLSTHDPIGEIKRDNGLGGRRAVFLDRTQAAPPAGFGRNSRSSIATAAQGFQVVGGNVVYLAATDGRLWRSTTGTKDAHVIAPSVVLFRVTASGQLFVLDRDGVLWRANSDGAGRASIDRAVKDFEFAGGAVYVRDADGALWRENPDGSGRVPIDKAVIAFQPLDAHVVFVLGADNRLWRETDDTHSRALVASSIHAFQYIPDGDTTFVITASGDLWRQSGKNKAEHVDKDVAAFRAADMNLVYVLARDGRLWQELGDRSQAVLVDRNVWINGDTPTFDVIDARHLYVVDGDRKLWAETMPPGR